MNLFALVVSLWLVWLYPPRVQQSLVFEVTTDMPPASGRLFVVLGRNQGEPRTAIGRTGMDAAPVLARDVSNFGRGNVATLDRSAAIFPIANLDALPAAERQEEGELIRTAIQGLPTDQREAFILRHYHGLSYDEIAKAVEVPLGTVKWRIHEAVRRLERYVAPCRVRGSTE